MSTLEILTKSLAVLEAFRLMKNQDSLLSDLYDGKEVHFHESVGRGSRQLLERTMRKHLGADWTELFWKKAREHCYKASIEYGFEMDEKGMLFLLAVSAPDPISMGQAAIDKVVEGHVSKKLTEYQLGTNLGWEWAGRVCSAVEKAGHRVNRGLNGTAFPVELTPEVLRHMMEEARKAWF